MTKQAANNNETVAFDSIREGSLFVLPGYGVLRKIHPCQATDKKDNVRVIYPEERVGLLKRKGGQ